MQAYRIETNVGPDGSLMVRDLPFLKGQAVEVIVLPSPPKEARLVTEAELHPLRQMSAVYLQDPFAPAIQDDAGEQARYPLRGTPYTYTDPFEPVVPPEDWEAL